MRAELLQSLYARMQAIAAGDPEPVLAPEALAEADQLLTLLGIPEGPDFRVLHAVGHLLWSRCGVLGEQAHPSIELAQMLLAPLFVRDASLVPAELAAHLEPYRSPSDAGEAGRSYDLGSSLAEIAIWLDEPSTYAGAVDLLAAAVALSGTDDPRRPTYLAALGKVLRRRYQSRGEPADLDNAIGVLRECRSASPIDDPDLVGTLIELGTALCLAFERTEDPAPLREAVDIARTVLAISSPAPPERDVVLDFATTVLTTAAGPHQDVALVADAVRLARRAVDASSTDDPRHPVRVGRLALALDQVPDDAAVTHEATRLMCRAIPAIALGDPTRLSLLSALRNRLLLRDEPQVDDDTLALATAVFEQAVDVSSSEQPDYALCHAGLAAALQLRWIRTDDDQVRDRMFDAVRAMSAAVPEGQAARHSVEFADAIADGKPRVDGAGLEWSRAEDRAALDATVRTLRSAVGAVPVNRRLLPMWLADLAELLYGRCRWRPDAAGVAEAIAVHRRLLSMTQDRHAQWTVGLASLLRQSFLLTADDAALAEAVEILRAAELDPHARHLLSAALVDLAVFTGDVDLCHDAEAAVRAVLSAGDLPDEIPSSWHNLSVMLGLRYERSGDGLAEAFDAARRSVALGGSEPAGQSERLAHLAQLLALDEEYDEAVQVARQAMAGCPPGHPSTPMVQGALASVLRLRYLRFGCTEELDESISLLREAVRSTTGPGTRSVRMSALAAALRIRYGRAADLDTLEEAIAVGRQAVRELPGTHQGRMKLRANLMVPLLEHYERTGDAASLEEAIGIGREVTAATPANHSALGIRLTTFATALTAEFRRIGARHVLEEALAVRRRAVDLAPPGHPDRALRLSNLSAALVMHVELTGDPDSADAAVRTARAAVAGTPADHPSRAMRLINLAVAMGAVVGRTGDVLLALEAVRIAEAAARLTAAAPSVRLRACRVRGRLAAATDQWAHAADAFREGVRLLPRVAPRNLRRADAEHQLAGIDAVHVNAAASALWAGDAVGAVEVLEQGRGVLLSYALDSRNELTDLRAAAPELAAQMERLIGELDLVGEPAPTEDGEPDLDHRHGLASRWDALLVRIRAVAGFARFGEPPSIESLLPAAAFGPVIALNVSELRCDALIVAPDGVRVVPLPGLTAADVEARVSAFLDALDLVNEGDRAAQVTVRETLGWLWDVIAEPVLSSLGYTAAPSDGASWPHVWWSPTGLLNFLPLHAAGRHDEVGRAVLDRVVSSYTPTLRALLHARSRPALRHPALLAVALSETPGQVPLPATITETASLVQQLDEAVHLVNEAATYDTVLAALPRSGWAHFACHAYSDTVSPSESRLLLYDGSLTVADISRLRLRDAELAYLSACSTARGSKRLADEAIHIAAAFQLAGYRHVVAAMWPVLDSTAATISAGFYARLRHGVSPAEALHEVIRQLREAQPRLPSAWASYVHAGS